MQERLPASLVRPIHHQQSVSNTTITCTEQPLVNSVSWFSASNDHYGLKREGIVLNSLSVFNYKSFFSGNLGNRWRFAHVTANVDSPFQLAFEAVAGTGVQVNR